MGVFAAGMPVEAKDFTSVEMVSVKPRPDSVPVGTILAWQNSGQPDESEKWIECDGLHSIPAGKEYDQLRKLYPGGLPNLNNQFLRGGTASQTLTTAADSIKEHVHARDPHYHSVYTSLSNPAFSGTADRQIVTDHHTGQSLSGIPYYTWYEPAASGIGEGWYYWLNPNPYISASVQTVYLVQGAYQKTADASVAAGNISNGHESGNASSSTPVTRATGDTETAPVHIRTRYFVRAIR